MVLTTRGQFPSSVTSVKSALKPHAISPLSVKPIILAGFFVTNFMASCIGSIFFIAIRKGAAIKLKGR